METQFKNIIIWTNFCNYFKKLKENNEKYISKKENRDIKINKAVIRASVYFNKKLKKATK